MSPKPDWLSDLIFSPTEALILVATEGNGSFSRAFPGMQIMLDSTSLGDFKRCPRYYFYSMICGLRSAGGSPHLDFGLLLHATIEHYHHARAIGMEHDDALDAALEWVLEATWERELKRGWMSNHPTKNRKSLIQTAVWYLDNFKNDPIRTMIFSDGRPAVEVSFRFDSGYRANGQQVMFCGHFDRIGLLGEAEEPVITDPKTTEGALDQRWFDKWTPGNQFSLYALGGRIVIGRPITKIIVDGIQVGAGFARFRRQVVPRSEEQIQEWHRDAGRWIGGMAECAARADWPQNDKACLGGDTEVSISRGTRKGWKIKIADLYWLLKRGGRRFDPSLETYVLCNKDGFVGNNKLIEVLFKGTKETFRVYTDNGYVDATADHRFQTSSNWKEVQELVEGDQLLIWNKRQGLDVTKKCIPRAVIGRLLYYPFGRLQKNGRTKNQRVSRLVIEAKINNLSLDEFVHILRTDQSKSATFTFLSPTIDGDESNDNLSNLEALTPQEHKQKHNMLHQNRLGLTKVVKIERKREEPVYDLAMEAPFHNFIANGLVAHNCDLFGGCQFRELCSRSPLARAAWAKANYKHRVWDPTVVRGDI